MQDCVEVTIGAECGVCLAGLDTLTRACTHTLTDTHGHMHEHADTCTHTHTHSCPTHTHTHTLARTHSGMHACTHESPFQRKPQ